MPSLEEQLRQFAEKTDQKLRTVTRKAALEMAQDMIHRSPMDTGRFRGAWVYGAGTAIPTEAPDTPDKTGDVSVARVVAGLESFVCGQTIWIVNNLPYATRLEYGWSQQAPSGFVRIAVANFVQIVEDAIKEAP